MRVAVLSEIRLYREGIARVLRDCSKIGDVDCVDGIEQLLECDRQRPPDVVFLDSNWENPAELLSFLREFFPDTAVIALGIRDDPAAVVRCAEAGVSAYVTREASLDDVVRAVRCAGRGELECSKRVAAGLFARVGKLAANAEPETEDPGLTPREIEVLCLLDAGMSNKEIAAQLYIEVATTKNHVHNILAKLSVARRGQAAKAARRKGLLSRVERTRRAS